MRSFWWTYFVSAFLHRSYPQSWIFSCLYNLIEFQKDMQISFSTKAVKPISVVYRNSCIKSKGKTTKMCISFVASKKSSYTKLICLRQKILWRTSLLLTRTNCLAAFKFLFIEDFRRSSKKQVVQVTWLIVVFAPRCKRCFISLRIKTDYSLVALTKFWASIFLRFVLKHCMLYVLRSAALGKIK